MKQVRWLTGHLFVPRPGDYVVFLRSSRGKIALLRNISIRCERPRRWIRPSLVSNPEVRGGGGAGPAGPSVSPGRAVTFNQWHYPLGVKEGRGDTLLVNTFEGGCLCCTMAKEARDNGRCARSMLLRYEGER